MILSFHPCFVADRNRICAGRPPDGEDLAQIQKADRIILSQGCAESLYKMARDNCKQVFPNYDVRFAYPGKIGQAHLFKEFEAAHPFTLPFQKVAYFEAQYPFWESRPPLKMPFVLKFDWGGEGKTVFLVESQEAFSDLIARAGRYETTGQFGFLLQEYIPCADRSLRVVAIGRRRISYWRVQERPGTFQVSLVEGGRLDAGSDPDLQQAAREAVDRFCHKTGIDLAGFDLLFRTGEPDPTPLFLEINWFFGRKGLGGSENYYALLTGEIQRWIEGNNPHGETP